MNAEHLQRVEALFAKALACEAGARRECVRVGSGGDPELEAEVLELLAFSERTEMGPLDREVAVSGVRPEPEAVPGLEPGMRVGHYHIERPLGEGGMGVVYVARQERPRRTVALKLIRPGFATATLLKRFENEADVLGRLHHPGIAHIYEAGTADTGLGPQPYFAMELVEGPPLVEYCRGATVREKVGLVAKICRAVEHAHQRGVIHRDLKPANILVDRTGQPKVLDFGVSRATTRDPSTSMMETRAGQLVGTLPYMSPEQVVGDPNDIDTRADVYALGVILYQLLTGRLPHELASLSVPEAARVIADGTPERLARHDSAYRGDLDTMVSRAMAKERHRRYQSAAEFADELERFLSGRPIEARRDSTLYVAGKHLRRHWALATGSACAVLLLALFAVMAARQAAANRRLADSNGELATQNALARDKITTSRDQLAASLEETRRAREQAELQLSNSNLDRARLLADGGDSEESLRLFWGEFFRRPQSAQTRLALWGFYAQSSIAAIDSGLRVDTPLAAAFPDGERAILPGPSVGGELQLQIYDARSLKPVSLIPIGTRRCTDVVVSADGKSIAAGTYSGDVLVFDAQGTRIATREPMNVGSSIIALALSPDGATVAACGQQRIMSTFELPSGRRLATLDLAMAPGRAAYGSLAFATNGRLFGTSWTGVLSEFDPRTLDIVRSATISEDRLDTLALSPDGVTMACSTYNGELFLVSIDTFAPIRRWTAGRCSSRGVQFLDDGTRVLTCGASVRLWTTAGELDRTLGSNPDHNCAIAYMNGPRRILSISSSATMRAIDRDGRGTAKPVRVSKQGSVTVSISPDGRVACFVPFEGRATLVEVSTGRLIGRAPAELGGAYESVFGPGNVVYFAAETPHLCVFHLDTGDFAIGTALGDAYPFSVAISPDQSLVAVGDQGGFVHLIDAHTQRRLRSIKVGSFTVRAVRFVPTSDDGPGGAKGASVPRLIGLETETFEIDVETGAVVPGPLPGKGYTSLAVSRDGSWIAGMNARGVDVQHLEKPEDKLRRLESGGAAVSSCVFAANSAVLLTGHLDGSVRAWDLESGFLATTFRDMRDRITGIAVSPDGRWVLLAGGGGAGSVRDLAALDANIAASLPWSRQLLRAVGVQADTRRATAALEEISRHGASCAFWGCGPTVPSTAPEVIWAWGQETLTGRE